MKKQKMERLDAPLFQPLTDAEGSSLAGGITEMTQYISILETSNPNPDLVRDSG